MTTIARIGDGVDRVAEADDDLLVRHAAADVRLGLVGRAVTVLDLERDLVSAAVLGPAQRADGAGDRTNTGPSRCRRSRAR